jgi:type II secretory pathway pseudopilin PulG
MNKLSNHIVRKLPAFTLPELVVGMLLMAIIFSFISMVYLIFTRQASLQLATGRTMQEYLATRHSLQYDLERAAVVYYNTSSDNFIFRTTTSDSIAYRFDATGILRSRAGHTDTLQPGATIIEKTFENDSLFLIKTITLEYTGRFNQCHMYLQKKYAIADLLNQHP